MKLPLFRIIAAFGIAFLIIGAVLAFKTYAPTGVFDTIFDGKTVTCNVKADAELLGTPLRIRSVSCTAAGSCIVSPSKTLAIFGIGDVQGSLTMKYNNMVYDTTSIKENVFSTADGAYSLSSCLPSSAQTVQVGILNDKGGVLNEQTVTVQ